MEYRLPKEFAYKWLLSLRSGEYKQGKDVLCKNDEYCCLGIACLLGGSILDEIKGKTYISTEAFYGLLSLPPNIPEELVGVNKNNALVKHLSNMNDNGSSFSEIADWIEENVTFY